MDAGIRVFFYLEDRERTLDSAMDTVMLSLTNFAAEMEHEKARQLSGRSSRPRRRSSGDLRGGGAGARLRPCRQAAGLSAQPGPA
jgi:hypothetical protein